MIHKQVAEKDGFYHYNCPSCGAALEIIAIEGDHLRFDGKVSSIESCPHCSSYNQIDFVLDISLPGNNFKAAPLPFEDKEPDSETKAESSDSDVEMPDWMDYKTYRTHVDISAGQMYDRYFGGVDEKQNDKGEEDINNLF